MAKDRRSKATLNSNQWRLALRLTSVREDAGMTQAELAARLNRPQSYVSKCENGSRAINITDLTDFASALDVSLLYLLIDFLDDKSLKRLAEWLEWQRQREAAP
jgi:transcriptional regulator with XRE-family HTH domain